jgi:hypothetical protein
MILAIEDVYPPEPNRCECGAPLPPTGRRGRPRKRCVTCAEVVEKQRMAKLKGWTT